MTMHPEINWIEQFWNVCKRYARENATRNITGLRKNIPEAMDFVYNGVSIHRFDERPVRVMSAYHEGTKVGTQRNTQSVYKPPQA